MSRKMSRMIKKPLLSPVLSILCLLLVPAFAFAGEASGPAKAGEISAYTGEVLVRTGGVWKKLDKVPHPLYSADKVVTRRGRAEIKLSGAGVFKMDLDTNISVVETQSGSSAERRINVLVGELWFSIKDTKGGGLKFRTPSMTASVKGASGVFRVPLKGLTQYRLTSGSAAFSGTFKALTGTIHVGPPDMTANILPSSNPVVDAAPMQVAAVEAMKAQDASQRAEAELAAKMRDAGQAGGAR